jgi:quercetin dioxygenase-like cupin family protein
MKHVRYTDVPLEKPSEECIKDIKVRWLISEKDGAPTFAMRLFEVSSGGYSPLHQHDWEHEVFIVEGKGEMRDKTHAESFKQGDVFFIKPMEWHQFINTGKVVLKFLCLIPNKK